MHSLIRISLFAPVFACLLSPFFSAAQTRPEALPPIDSLNVGQMQQILGTLGATVQELSGGLNVLAQQTDSIKGLSLNQWNLAKQDSTNSKAVLDSLSKIARAAEKSYKKAADQANKAAKLRQFIENAGTLDSLGLRKSVPKAWKQTVQLYDDVYPAPAPVLTDKEETNVEKTKKERKKEEDESTSKVGSAAAPPGPAVKPVKKFATYNPANDVMLHPPAPPCVIASSSRDEFSGEISREMARAELFRYTNPALKNYLQGKTHVICEAALASAGPKTTLLLTFTINDPNARKAFGRMEKNSLATLKFMDGSNFELQNAVADDGTFNPDNESSIFRAQYPLTPEAVKKLRHTELDKLRILWSKGYDDYDVQQVDLLIRQSECLFGK